MNYTTLRGVPIFRPGRRRGEHYPPERMRQIVRNSNRMRPYFRGIIKTKLTHMDAQPGLLEQAALGQAVRYYLKPGPGGPFVMADFMGVPEPIAQAAPHHFPNVSVEKYRWFDPGDGERVPDVIKAVALLGADAPEVKGLRRVYPQVFNDAQGALEYFEMEDIMKLGETIAAWRESLAMTPDDLAGAIGKTPDELAQIEAGTLDPDAATLQALADALGTTPADLQAGVLPEAAKAENEGEPAKFSERDVQQMIQAAVNQAVAPLRRQLTTLTVKARRSETELFAERQARKQGKIAAIIKGWRTPNADGLALPAVLVDMGLQAFMAGLDDSVVETFAEGTDAEKTTKLAWFEQFMQTFREVGLVDEGQQAERFWERGDMTDPHALIEAEAKKDGTDYKTAARKLSKAGKLKL